MMLPYVMIVGNHHFFCTTLDQLSGHTSLNQKSSAFVNIFTEFSFVESWPVGDLAITTEVHTKK
jgi:hypothetical protein